MILAGIFIAILAIYFGVPEIQENLGTYIQSHSFLLVAGGTISATLVSTSWTNMRRFLSSMKAQLLPGKNLSTQADEAVKKLVQISELAQQRSRQELVNEGQGFGDGFLDRALNLLGSGLEREFIAQTLRTDIEEDTKRHLSTIRLARSMGTYAPLFGMAGTVMGIIQVLRNVTDVDNIVSGMSLALLTTLYGLLMTAVFFIPLSNRLRQQANQEKQVKEIIAVGILAIYDKEIPLKVKRSLTAYLDASQQSHGR